MIFASNNEGKLREIRQILNDYDIYSLKDKNIKIDIIEDEDTFLSNALKKAKEIYNITKEATIADDSGLCINALNGFPGVKTNRFIKGTDKEKCEYLINETNKYKDRSAKVVCCLVYYDGINTIVGNGILEGYISKELRGENGFGFDPIFELDNGHTLAELTPKEKNMVSARAIAIKDLKDKLVV